MLEVFHFFQVLSDDNMNFGYNAASDCYEDLMKAGIMDPTKVWLFDNVTVEFHTSAHDGRFYYLEFFLQVVRCCIEHSASVAKAFLTSNAAVIDLVQFDPIPRGKPMATSGTETLHCQKVIQFIMLSCFPINSLAFYGWHCWCLIIQV